MPNDNSKLNTNDFLPENVIGFSLLFEMNVDMTFASQPPTSLMSSSLKFVILVQRYNLFLE